MTRPVVRFGGVLPEGDDHVEGRRVGSVPSHRELELRRGLPLGDPDDEHLEDVLERAVGGFLCCPQLRELLGVLGPSEPFDLFPHTR